LPELTAIDSDVLEILNNIRHGIPDDRLPPFKYEGAVTDEEILNSIDSWPAECKNLLKKLILEK